MSVAVVLYYADRWLKYDPISGVVIWRRAVNSRVSAGSRAGTVRPDGRRQIKIDGKTYLEHRLIFAMVMRRWPDPEVDHEDGDPSNNAWLNLREATVAQNRCNTAGHRHKLSGLPLGVYAEGPKFRACLQREGKQIRIGVFATIEEALAARMARDCEVFGGRYF